MNLVFFQG